MSSPQCSSNAGCTVSSIISTHQCPRRYYFAKNKQISSSGKYSICKQVSIAGSYPDEEALWDEIMHIHPGIDIRMRDLLTSYILNCRKTPIPSWTDLDLLVRSERYKFHGQIDKYDAQKKVISVVRCTGAPAIGCWPADRIRAAAYLLCLTETFGITPSGCYIEYIPDGVIRFCEPQPRDRRALFAALKMIHRIEAGELPPKPLKAPCTRCTYSDRCTQPTVRTLSEIFFKK
ncbi:MAG TPA: Dna2/Cas4 domain-containing protein [Methanospirillum sp.]|nr:Dna2/Cas4 domain-containing protein [Methanospirillum sp.]